MSDRPPQVEFRNVQLIYETDEGETEALRGLDFCVDKGRFVSILGPSGCGKSTTLSLIAGLRKPTQGEVLTDGAKVQGPTKLVGYVTQQDNLLPWRTVAANVRLPLEVQGVPRRERNQRVRDMLKLVALEGFEDHYPSQLSGGMRKRVTLARTLIYEPEVLLLDEPFSALDAQLRAVLQQELLRIWTSIGCTVIFVTHDIGEAISLSDRVIVLSKKPAQIITDREINIPRPRNVTGVAADEQYQKNFSEFLGYLEAA